jgi:uncharacterized protein YjbI with pentapeptide repeats
VKFQIKNRFSGAVQFECELGSEFEALGYPVQLGAAVKIAIKAGADLSRADLSRADLSGADDIEAAIKAYDTAAKESKHD